MTSCGASVRLFCVDVVTTGARNGDRATTAHDHQRQRHAVGDLRRLPGGLRETGACVTAWQAGLSVDVTRMYSNLSMWSSFLLF